MWKYERANNAFELFEGFHGSVGYSVRVSKSLMELLLADTTTAKLHFSNVAELLTIWDVNADTCWVIGFEPMVVSKRNYRWKSSPVWLDTSCHVHIPLFTYQSVLDKQRMGRLRQLTIDNLAKQFNGSTINDTIFRVIRFKSDSNEYLPQARYKHIGEIMKGGMIAGQLSVYSDKKCATRLSKNKVDESFVKWDSLNYVEEPTNPGSIVIVPIKVEQLPLGIVVYEKWVPFDCSREQYNFSNYRPQPYLRYTRQVLAYGLLLSDGRVNWVTPEKFKKVFESPSFNLEPYEESFRAERFERMHIALEP